MACIYRAQLQDKISVAKTDVYHRYMWLKITNGGRIYFIVCCYIPHIGSTFYNSYGADPQDPFGYLGIDICYFSTQGKVIIMGDMNARIGNVQIQPMNELDKNEEVDVTWAWQRVS